MQLDTKMIVSVSEANKNFSRVARITIRSILTRSGMCLFHH